VLLKAGQRVNVLIPRRQPNRSTIGVNCESAAIAPMA
jgi:hypothetical protein